MMPKTRRTRIGMTSANSTTAAPSSFLMNLRVRIAILLPDQSGHPRHDSRTRGDCQPVRNAAFLGGQLRPDFASGPRGDHPRPEAGHPDGNTALAREGPKS